MASTTRLLLPMSPERFQTLLAASPKKLREEIFRRAGIKTQNSPFSLKTSPKNEVRVQKLQELIQGGLTLPEELAQELVRNYLVTRRPLLRDALDFLEIPHTDGLTDADLDFMEKLPKDVADGLRAKLAAHDADDVALYLNFMNVPA